MGNRASGRAAAHATGLKAGCGEVKLLLLLLSVICWRALLLPATCAAACCRCHTFSAPSTRKPKTPTSCLWPLALRGGRPSRHAMLALRKLAAMEALEPPGAHASGWVVPGMRRRQPPAVPPSARHPTLAVWPALGRMVRVGYCWRLLRSRRPRKARGKRVLAALPPRANPTYVSHELLAHGADVGRQRGREHHDLLVVGRALEDGLHVRAHVDVLQALVALVHHKVAHVGQV